MEPVKRPILTRRAFALAAVGIARAEETPPGIERWVIGGAEAGTLVGDGALLLFTRPADARGTLPINGAVPVERTTFSNPNLLDKGKLLTDNAGLTGRLRAIGVSADRPVVVVTDPMASWGEDGRIVWTLRTLGHDRVLLVDGGALALLAEGPVTAAPAGTGTFALAGAEAYQITKETLAASLYDPDVMILDTRQDREYKGETWGAHVPGARQVFYRDLVAADGTVLKGDALRDRLASLGVGEGTTVVSYCTGGIRSGFVTAVLRTQGSMRRTTQARCGNGRQHPRRTIRSRRSDKVHPEYSFWSSPIFVPDPEVRSRGDFAGWALDRAGAAKPRSDRGDGERCGALDGLRFWCDRSRAGGTLAQAVCHVKF